MMSLQQEIDAIETECQRVADVEEEKSIKRAIELSWQEERVKQIAADKVEWVRLQNAKRVVSVVEKKDSTGRECKSGDYIYDSLLPGAGEIKLKCPWCMTPQLMEINCGIAHCGFRYVTGKLRQLPPHGILNEFTGKSFVVGGCGKQFMYNRASKEVEKSYGQ